MRSNAGSCRTTAWPVARNERRLARCEPRQPRCNAASVQAKEIVIPKRSYGTGSIYVRAGNWYGRWWVGDQRVKRKLGAIRDPGSRTGLTKSQAEREMRRRMDAEAASVSLGDRFTVAQAGERLIDQLELSGLRPTTITVYRSLLRTHLARHLGERELARVTP